MTTQTIDEEDKSKNTIIELIINTIKGELLKSDIRTEIIKPILIYLLYYIIPFIIIFILLNFFATIAAILLVFYMRQEKSVTLI